MPPIIGPIIRKPHPTPASVVGNIVGSVVSPPAVSAVGNIVGGTIGAPAAVAPVGNIVGSVVHPSQPNVGQVAQTAARALIQRIQRERQHASVLSQVPSYVPAQYRRSIARAAHTYGVRPELLSAQLQQESGFDPNAGSPAGAQGIAQFEPGTAASVGLKNPYNPHASIQAQGRLMGQLLQKYGGSERLALAAYNAGEGAVASAGNRVPSIPETQNYVQSILGAAGGHDPYTYPFDPGISVGRTDEGIDPSGSGLIRAIGRSRYLGQGGAGWPSEGGSGTGPVYKLLSGPRQGENVYTYEGITPRAGLERGDILHRGEPIASSTGSSFETGWAQGRAAGFQPVASPHYSEGDVTAEGLDFGKLVASLGGGGPLPGRSSFVPATGSTAYAGTGGTAGGYAAGGTGGATGAMARRRASGGLGGGSRTPWTAQAPEPGTGPVVPTDAPIADQLAQASQRRAADLQQTLDLIASLGGG